jgi:hypothetical protein
MRDKSDSTHGTNNVVVPGVPTLLDRQQIIFLLIVEDSLGTRTLASRSILVERCGELPELQPIVL